LRGEPRENGLYGGRTRQPKKKKKKKKKKKNTKNKTKKTKKKHKTKHSTHTTHTKTHPTPRERLQFTCLYRFRSVETSIVGA